MFNVSWLSDYTAESERLFIGGFKRLSIESIIDVSSAHNYLYYVKAINNLYDLIQGFKNEYPFDNQTRSIFKKLIFYQQGEFKKRYEKTEENKVNNNDNDDNNNSDSEYGGYDITEEVLAKWNLSIPEYIKYLFKNWCENTNKQIILNVERINNNDTSGSYSRIKHLFISDDNTSINLKTFCMLFINLKYIVIKNGLTLHDKTFQKIIKFLANKSFFKINNHEKSVCNLKEIVIIKPNEKHLNIDDAKELYLTEMNKFGWNIQCGKSQITGQNFIKIKRK